MLCVKIFNKLSTSVLQKSTSNCKLLQFRCLAAKSMSKEANEIKQKELKENWEPIYRYPSIKAISMLTKLKDYQTVTTIVGLPIAYYFDSAFVFGYCGLVGIFTFSIASLMIKNSIGFIYVNKNNSDVVRFAYIDFWGRRKDIEVDAGDITPFSDLPQSLTDKLYTKLRFTNGQHELKLISKSSEIINPQQYARIFGE